jgi:hypothetical protein
MKDYDKIILNNLLDAYERSSLYKGKNERNISIDFKFTQNNISEYFDHTSSVYEEIHSFMRKLEEKSFIRIVWKNNKINHVITKVILKLENVELAYRYLKRQQLSRIENECEKILAEFAETNEVLINFCSWASNRLKDGLSVKKYFDIQNTTDLSDLLKGVLAVTNNSEDYYIRELSTLIYHDSKKLEALLGRIETIIKEFYPDKVNVTDNYDILGEFNLSRNPVWIMLKGAGSFSLKNSRVKLSDFDRGIGLSGNEILNIDIKKDETVKRIITVENLTAFNRIHNEGSLIIYLAGFHNRPRRELLQRVYKVYDQADYFHWGDIDVGGFKIYFDLCKKTCIPFKMLWMDADTLDKYKKYAKKLTDNDRKELLKFLEKSDYSSILPEQRDEFIRVIKVMLDLDIKLEQEIIYEGYIVK